MSNDAKEKIEQINAWLASESSQIKEVRAQIPKQIASHGKNIEKNIMIMFSLAL